MESYTFEVGKLGRCSEVKVTLNCSSGLYADVTISFDGTNPCIDLSDLKTILRKAELLWPMAQSL